ncbi:MAG TPA: glycosyltransferase, partial [Bacteroidales bacterium]|nr:glycosyltransferase [Bacteroidales bacterium]
MTRPLFVHVSWEPRTGVWSVIKNLISRQISSGYGSSGVFFASDVNYTAWLSAEISAHSMDARILRSPASRLARLAPLFDRRLSNHLRSLQHSNPGCTLFVHFHDAHFSAAFLPLGKDLKAVSVTTFHGCPNGLLQGGRFRLAVHRWLGRRLGLHTDAMVSVDRYSVPLIAEKLRLSEGSVVTIYNGVPFSPDRVKLKTVEKKKNFIVGFVGALEERKQWKLAAEASRTAFQENHSIRFILAGDGPERDQAEQWVSAGSDFATYLGQ